MFFQKLFNPKGLLKPRKGVLGLPEAETLVVAIPDIESHIPAIKTAVLCIGGKIMIKEEAEAEADWRKSRITIADEVIAGIQQEEIKDQENTAREIEEMKKDLEGRMKRRQARRDNFEEVKTTNLDRIKEVERAKNLFVK